jgi:hypothetical protein
LSGRLVKENRTFTASQKTWNYWGCVRGQAPQHARVNDTLVVTGYVAHTVTARKRSRVLIGTEPHRHLDWLARSQDLVCVPKDPTNPLIRRLHARRSSI